MPAKKRKQFFKWLYGLEHEIMGIPGPDHHYLLHLPAKLAQDRVLKKSARKYTSKKLDGHESDLKYLKNVELSYLELAKTFPKKFTVIDCVDGKHQKTVEEIQSEIWNLVKKRLK